MRIGLVFTSLVKCPSANTEEVFEGAFYAERGPVKTEIEIRKLEREGKNKQRKGPDEHGIEH